MLQQTLRPARQGSARPEPRPPLPAGHPLSWGILTRGTMLDGVAWPGTPTAHATPGGREPHGCAA